MMPVTKVVQILGRKCTRSVWGRAHNPLGELTPLPRPPSWVYQRERDRGRRKRKRDEGMGSRGRGTEEGGQGGREEGRKRKGGEISPHRHF